MSFLGGFNGSHCGIELGQTPISYTATFPYISGCQMVCLYSYVWPHSENILEFTSFQARIEGFWPPEAKRPRVGSGHYEHIMAKCITYQEILVRKTLQKTS